MSGTVSAGCQVVGNAFFTGDAVISEAPDSLTAMNSDVAEEQDGDQNPDVSEEGLGESDDVRRIKEEWTRLQVEADTRGALQEAQELREEIQEEVTRKRKNEVIRKRSMELQAEVGMPSNSRRPPPGRLPSLDSMIDRIPSIPSMEISTGLGKRLPDLGSVSHRLGIISDPKELEPQAITLEKTAYTFGTDTPTQTDIRWAPPANASNFTPLTYNIEVDGGNGWTPLTDNRLPILRVYFTSDKIIVGRFTRAQEAEPVAVRIRVRATGTIRVRAQEEIVSGPWSEEIWLQIEGSTVTSNTAV